MADKRRTSIFCNDWIAYTDVMDNETAGILFKKMLAVRNGRETPPIQDSLKFVLAHIQNFWDEQDEKYKEIEKRNKENGKKGGRPPNKKPKKPKETLTDTNTIYTDIYNTYIDNNIIKHKELNKEIKENIRKLLKEMSVEEIKTAINNYGKIYNSKRTYFNHRRTLSEFLSRKNGARVFLYKTESDYLNGDIEKGEELTDEEYSAEKRKI